MHFFKKLFICTLATLLLLVLPLEAFANTSSGKEEVEEALSKEMSFEEICAIEGASIINEFDALKEKQSKSVSSLRASGFTEKEIKTIKDTTYSDYISAIKTQQTDEELLENGLSQSEVDILRSSNKLGENGLTEEILRSASSTLSMSIVPRLITANKVNYMIYWHWNRSPHLRMTDIVATTWSSGFISDNNTTAVLVYETHPEYGNQMTYEKRLYAGDMDMGVGRSCSFQFPLQESDSAFDYTTLSGRAFISLVPTSTKNRIAMACKYGHQTIVGNITISIHNVGITFSSNVIDLGHDYDQYDF